jgi:hypothetical protein
MGIWPSLFYDFSGNYSEIFVSGATVQPRKHCGMRNSKPVCCYSSLPGCKRSFFLFFPSCPLGDYQSLMGRLRPLSTEYISCIFYAIDYRLGKWQMLSQYPMWCCNSAVKDVIYKFLSSHIWNISLIQSKKNPELDKFKFLEQFHIKVLHGVRITFYNIFQLTLD